jgi:DNA-directed RNA polymerase specialized sigma24 family protein
MDTNVTELELVVRAQKGDKKAMSVLWEKYRFSLIGILRDVKSMQREERESEAAELFMHKLMEIFKSEKIGKSKEEWTFSYILTGGARNLRDKLINRSKKDGCFTLDYDEAVSPADEEINYAVANAMAWNDQEYMKYNPESEIIEKQKEDPAITEKRLYEQLSPIQRSILKLRKAGLSLQEVADRMDSSLSMVRKQYSRAKQEARIVFSA